MGELVARLVGSSFLALIGASGSGKSSALRAGLMPALVGGVLPGSESWRVVSLRPGEHPMAELEQALGGDPDAALAGLEGDQRLVLIVDQFEELFNSTRDETQRAAFVEALTTEREKLKVVLALRADHYGQCAAYPALARLVGGSSVLVGALGSAELTAIIEHPAQRVGLRVEPELTQALLADVGDEPGALPLLSTALLELWQARDDGWLTLAAYRSAGGVRGAVARLAESAYEALNADQRRLARSIFLRLAGQGEGAAVVRRRVQFAEFSSADDTGIEATLQKMVDARLLIAGDGYVEVAHEALLREWPRLQAWLEQDAVGRQVRLHVIGAASDWAARGREAGDLYRGPRLAAALEWAAEHDDELNAQEREFLGQSRRVSEAEVERQHQINRRLRLLLAGTGVLLLVSVVAGGYAAYQAELARQSEEIARTAQQAAEQAQQFARSRELAASAIAARDEDPTLSKLLALAAASIADPPVESVAALHRAWDADRVIYRYTWPADHDVSYLNVDLDLTGRHIVAAGGAFLGSDYLEVVDRVSGERLWSFQPSTDGLRVGAAYFTPDGSRVVFGAFFGSEPPPRTSSAEAGVYVRDARSGAAVNTIALGGCGASVVAVSNSTAIVYTSSAPTCLTFGGSITRRDISLESIDLVTGQRNTLTNAASGNDANAVSADGSTVVFDELPAQGDPTLAHVVVERPFAGQRVELPGVWTMDISADGSRLVADDGISLKVWELDGEDLATIAGSAPVSVFAPDPNTHAYYARFALDGLSVFSTGADGHLHQWDVESGNEIFSYAAPDLLPAPGVGGLVLVPSSATQEALLIDTTMRGEVAAFDNIAFAAQAFPGGNCVRSRAADPLSSIDALSTAADVVMIANDCWDDATPATDTLALLDRSSLQPIGLVRAGAVGALSPDGTHFARRLQRVADDVGLLTGPLEIADVASGETRFELEGLCWFDMSVANVSVLRDARDHHLNAGCADFPATPFAMAAYQRHDLRWSPDGRMIALVDVVDGYVGVWNALDGSLIEASLGINDPARKAYDVAFTPDSKHLVISYTTELTDFPTTNGLASVATTDWRIETTRELPDAAVNVFLLGSSADGSSIIAVSGKGGFNTTADKTLYWLDPITLADVRSPAPRIVPSTLVAAALSDDSTLVALGATDGSIRVWDDAGGLVHVIDFPGHPILGLAFISSTHLGVVLDDGNLRVVSIDTRELLDIARDSLTRGFTQEECDRYHFDPCPTFEQMRSATTAQP